LRFPDDATIPAVDDDVLLRSDIDWFDASFNIRSATISLTAIDALDIPELFIESITITPIFKEQALAARFANDPFGDGDNCVQTRHKSAVPVNSALGESSVTIGDESTMNLLLLLVASSSNAVRKFPDVGLYRPVLLTEKGFDNDALFVDDPDGVPIVVGHPEDAPLSNSAKPKTASKYCRSKLRECEVGSGPAYDVAVKLALSASAN
jgi:hypothetical protein